MKKIFFALTIATVVASLAIGQKQRAVKQVNVTAKMVASQPANSDYVLDLSGDTIYHLAANVEFSRVRLRSAESTANLGELIKKSGEHPQGEAHLDLLGSAVRVGYLNKILKKRTATASPNSRRGGSNFTCGDFVCVCHGDDDCNHLFTTNSCGPFAVCFTSGGRVTCFCSAAPH